MSDVHIQLNLVILNFTGPSGKVTIYQNIKLTLHICDAQPSWCMAQLHSAKAMCTAQPQHYM